jgi:hypothetical protein
MASLLHTIGVIIHCMHCCMHFLSVVPLLLLIRVYLLHLMVIFQHVMPYKMFIPNGSTTACKTSTSYCAAWSLPKTAACLCPPQAGASLHYCCRAMACCSSPPGSGLHRNQQGPIHGVHRKPVCTHHAIHHRRPSNVTRHAARRTNRQ